MKSKAPLALMEQLVMILVFALAAALCLRAFAYSYNISSQDRIRDAAMLQVQNIAEEVKACGGLEEWIGKNPEYEIEKEIRETDYYIKIKEIVNRNELLGTAEITAFANDGAELFGITAAWQEVAK